MARKHTVLVVEDDPMLALATVRVLRTAGYAIRGPASTYEQALILLNQGPVSIALLDVNLAGVRDGAELARVLVRRGIPSLFVTSEPERALESRAAAVGVLAKPFKIPALLAAIEFALHVANGQEPEHVPSGFARLDWHRNGKRV